MRSEGYELSPDEMSHGRGSVTEHNEFRPLATLPKVETLSTKPIDFLDEQLRPRLNQRFESRWGEN